MICNWRWWLTVGGFPLFVAAAVGLACLDYRNDDELSIGFAFVFGYIFQVPSIALHELAHSLVARLVGAQVQLIVIGSGPTLFKRRFGGTLAVIRAVPMSGYILATIGSRRCWRLRQWLLTAAGPIVHLIALLLIVTFAAERLDPTRPHHTPTDIVVIGLFLASGLHALANLLPHTTSVEQTPVANDGLQLLTIPFKSADAIRQAIRDAPRAWEGLVSIIEEDWPALERWAEQELAEHPDDPGLHFLAGTAQLVRGDSASAITHLRQADAADDKPGQLVDALANNLTLGLLFTGTPAALREADALSRSALENSPRDPHLIGTRGCVLIELGQIDAGLRLARRAKARHQRRSDRVAAEAALALGHLKRGDRAKAEAYLKRVLPFRDHDPYIRHVERRFTESGGNRPPTGD